MCADSALPLRNSSISDLFESPEERLRNVGDKQVIVHEFENQFEQSLEEYNALIRHTRRLSFNPEESKKALFKEKFKECIQERLDIQQFRD